MRSREAAHPPEGLVFRPEFITEAEEREILERLADAEYEEVRMHGVVARRRVIHFGWDYGYESWTIEPTEPIPDWLEPLRKRSAGLAGLEPADLGQCLVGRYEPGAGIGWHRDAPMFGPTVVGVSLGSDATMKLRRTEKDAAPEVYKLELPPRSVYVLSGPARSVWQHSVNPVKALRYAITFRTVIHPEKWLERARKGHDRAAKGRGASPPR
jgi:DNA oxidative demethylase